MTKQAPKWLGRRNSHLLWDIFWWFVFDFTLIVCSLSVFLPATTVVFWFGDLSTQSEQQLWGVRMGFLLAFTAGPIYWISGFAGRLKALTLAGAVIKVGMWMGMADAHNDTTFKLVALRLDLVQALTFGVYFSMTDDGRRCKWL